MSACEACLQRAWLLARLGGHLERRRADAADLLALSNDVLIDAIGGSAADEVRRQMQGFDGDEARDRCQQAGVLAICRCSSRYPARLAELQVPPAVLHVAGHAERLAEMLERDPVAIVGARRASPYGIDVARALGRGLAASGVTVISGMAQGVDAAAHDGALSATGPARAATIAVLPGPADRPYPPAKRGLFARISDRGAAVSELPPGSDVWRWTFPARNRIIAALACAVVVVEAGERSGALITADFARALGRRLGAVPGNVTAPMAVGPNALIANGAAVIRGAQDVLDVLFGAGERGAVVDDRAPLEGELPRLLRAIADGKDPPAAFDQLGIDANTGLAALAELELAGYIRRQPGGRFAPVP